MKIILSILVAGVLGCSGSGTDASGLFGEASSSASVGSGGASSVSSSSVGTATTSSSGGSGGASSSSSAMCVPDTCLDLGKNCGVVDDNGCGHKLDCGGCKGDYQACGDAPGQSGVAMGTANVCGGGCTPTQITSSICGMPVSWEIWGCNQAGNTAPLNTPGSFPTDLQGSGSLPSQFWCVPTGK